MYANTELKPIPTVSQRDPVALRRAALAPEFLPSRAAGNDPACGDDADERHELERWWRQAAAASGFGDADVGPISTYEVYEAARANRAAFIGDAISRALSAAVARARRAYVRYQQHREAWAVSAALRELDDRTLHDLGFDRSEIGSVAMEAAGLAARTRVRIE
jgi:uncharacterized protein YjiS (DUF1127 family)